MPRHRRDTALVVSLFPFLSILACVMGILTLLIAALAVGEIASPKSATERGDSALPISVWVERIAQYSRDLSRALDEHDRVEAIQAALNSLGLDPKTTPEDLERQIRDRAQLARLATEVESDLSEVEEIRSALQVMKTEISRIADLPLDAPIEILPSGVAERLAPYFVEVQGEGLRIRMRNGEWSELLDLDDLHQRGRFKVFLENVRSRGNATAIFLVRPSGVMNYLTAQTIATRNYVRFGKLAIPGNGVIDFKAVEQRPESTGAM